MSKTTPQDHRVGDRVRSYDFAHTGRRETSGPYACYVEGIIDGFTSRGWDCRRLRILVERDVWEGEERTGAGSRVGTFVHPPPNGTPTFGGVTEFIETLERADA